MGDAEAAKDVTISVGSKELAGLLAMPPGAGGVVLFAHGSGSSRLSPRNMYVAEVLGKAGLGTLLFDLLTTEEERSRSNVFDVPLLAGRLGSATDWLRSDMGIDTPVGYFGASTGAAAALAAAAMPEHRVAAVVSRGGRPDLAGDSLPAVRCPTLLIVGSRDPVVLDLNRQAAQRMTCATEVAIVAGATHLFEEPGTLARVADLAAEWFSGNLRQQPAEGPSDA